MLTTVVIVYLVAMLAVGAYVSTRIKFASDFLVAGRKLGLVLTTATLAAVQLGAGVILGGAENGAANGMWPGAWYGLGCGGGLILGGLFVAGRMRKQGGFVPLDFFAERFGENKGVRLWAWLSNIPSLLGIFAAQLMAIGFIIKSFGYHREWGIVIVGAIIMLYSVMGGMWGVVLTDLVQLAIIIIGIPLVALVVWLHPPAAAVAADAPTGMSLLATPFIPSGMFTNAVFLTVPFLLSISVSYDAFMRYQSAQSASIAKWGCILAGVIVIGISICAAFVGAAGSNLFPEVDADSVLPHAIKALFSPLVAGIIVSALLAAAMSSANCLLISLSGSFSRDFYNKVLHPSAKLDELKHAKLLSRIVVVVALLLGMLVAFKATGILDTIIIFNYPFMGSMLVPLLGGVLWRKATIQGALAAMIVGGVIGVGASIMGLPGLPEKLQATSIVGLAVNDFKELGLFIAYAVSTVVFVTVSLCTAKASKVQQA